MYVRFELAPCNLYIFQGTPDQMNLSPSLLCTASNTPISNTLSTVPSGPHFVSSKFSNATFFLHFFLSSSDWNLRTCSPLGWLYSFVAISTPFLFFPLKSLSMFIDGYTVDHSPSNSVSFSQGSFQASPLLLVPVHPQACVPFSNTVVSILHDISTYLANPPILVA